MIRRLFGVRPKIKVSSCPPLGCDMQAGRQPAVVVGSRRKQSLDIGRTRLMVAGAVFALAFLVVAGRVVELAVIKPGGEPRIASAGHSESFQIGRADIVDRNGIVLATTLPTASLYANARQIDDPARVAAKLAAVLEDVSQPRLETLLARDRAFVYLKRDLTPREQSEVNALGEPGLYFQKESKRVYPQGPLMSHIVGFTDIDGQGLAGMERAFDDSLRGSNEALSLSVDLRLQHILSEELAGAMTEFSGIGAAGVVMDAKTGEVMAMVSLPTFDPKDAGSADKDTRFNRATLGTYEMGSVFKLLTAAMALDSGVVKVSESFDVAKPIRVGGFTINDYKPKGPELTLPEVMIHSSNIGTVHMIERVGKELQQRYLGDFGLLDAASIELPEVGSPLVPRPWREINMMTVSYGHGLSVSPLQLVTAMSAVVNGGQRKTATLLKRPENQPVGGERVISPETSDTVNWLMRQVVTQGTGKFANAKGYLVGGKTGTADKLINGRYSDNARIASFIGAFPMDDPRYVIFAMVDEPKGLKRTYGYATGGWVAAPVVGRVVERMAPLLGVSRRTYEVAAPPAAGLLLEASANGATAH